MNKAFYPLEKLPKVGEIVWVEVSVVGDLWKSAEWIMAEVTDVHREHDRAQIVLVGGQRCCFLVDRSKMYIREVS